VFGTVVFNHVNAEVTAISCASAGNCAAGGYDDSVQVFVMNEKNGVWGNAIAVPGSVALNLGSFARLTSISCGGAGNCTAGGRYRDGSGHDQAFVVSSKGGVWGKAKAVPGTAALNAGGSAAVTSVSCATAKACAVGGTYSDGSNQTQSFVASGKIDATGKWVWSKAIIVPGTAAALHIAGFAQLNAISCRSATSCSAGGQFSGPHGSQAFVVNRTNGVWGKATELPGVSALSNTSSLVSISCASVGNCAATGDDNSGPGVFVAAETNGLWGNATQLPGLSALASSNLSHALSISCAKASTICAIGGYYDDGSATRAFVTSP
jgi:hypothetical protein